MDKIVALLPGLLSAACQQPATLPSADVPSANDAAADVAADVPADVPASADAVADAAISPDGVGPLDAAGDAEIGDAVDTDPEVADTAPVDAATCPTACTTSDPCWIGSCNPATGTCVSAPQTNGTACDDGVACTAGDACNDGKCVAAGLAPGCGCLTTADCTAKNDGKLCNGVLFCNKATPQWQCTLNLASPISCSPTSEPCKVAQCLEPTDPGGDPSGAKCALVMATDGTPCEDGKPQTVGDVCAAGACEAGTQVAQCVADSECAKYEDGNLCNGMLFCNKAKKLCQWNPTTQVVCPSVDNTLCRENQCQPKTGKCVLTPVNELKSCDDGNLCSSGDKCKDGACTPDANTCACKTGADCAKSEDGNFCNGTLFCDSTLHCAVNPVTVVACKGEPPSMCTKMVCQPASGICNAVALPDGATCDADSSACTPNDSCKKGLCASDTNTCDCKVDSDCPEDGDLCNGDALCDKAAHKCIVNPATVVVCKSVLDTSCSKNLCNPLDGLCKLVNINYLGPCDDADPSTANDTCDKGTCTGTASFDCKQDTECQDDGNPCNGKLVCNKINGKCIAVSVVQCDGASDTACSKMKCDPTNGKCGPKAVNLDSPCDDGTPCTQGDVCNKQGLCEPGQDYCCHSAADCTDGKVCNGSEFCNKAVFPFACAAAATATDGTGCEDGSVCTDADACQKGVCLAGEATTCNDGNGCTTDSCDGSKGCVFSINTGSCSDGDGCSEGDLCADGLCKAGAVKLCADGTACTVDACAGGACKNTPAVNGIACGDGGPCTALTTCADGKCSGKPALFSYTGGIEGKENFYFGIAPAADGGFVAAGMQVKAGPGEFTQTLTAVSPGGTLRYDLSLLLGHLYQVKALPGGGHAAVGSSDPKKSGGTTSSCALLRVTENGGIVWQKDVAGPGSGGFCAYTGMVVRADGNVTAVGTHTEVAGDGPAFVGKLVDLSADGVALPGRDFVYKTNQPDWSVSFAGVDLAPAGGYWVAANWQNLQSGAFHQARLVRIAASGTISFQLSYANVAGNASLSRVVADKDGAVAIGQGPDKANSAWIVRVDNAGKTVWQRYISGGKADKLSDLVASGDGGYFAVGTSTPVNATLPVAAIHRLTGSGEVAWQRLSVDEGGLWNGVAATAQILYLAGAAKGVQATGKKFQAGICDLFGNCSCAAAGGCLGKPQSDCDDKDPCTLDLCGAGQCSQLPVSDNTPCGTAAACLGGKCVDAFPANCVPLAIAGKPDGKYLIDPDGKGGELPFEVYCGNKQGGWARAATLEPNSAAVISNPAAAGGVPMADGKAAKLSNLQIAALMALSVHKNPLQLSCGSGPASATTRWFRKTCPFVPAEPTQEQCVGGASGPDASDHAGAAEPGMFGLAAHFGQDDPKRIGYWYNGSCADQLEADDGANSGELWVK